MNFSTNRPDKSNGYKLGQGMKRVQSGAAADARANKLGQRREGYLRKPPMPCQRWKGCSYNYQANKGDLYDDVVGLSGIVWYCAWEMIVHDSPSSHPTISHIERNFIETSIAGSKDKTEVSLYLCCIKY